MTSSDDHRAIEARSADRPTFSHYDFILAIVPVAFLLGYLGSSLGRVPLEGGMAVAAVVAGLAVLDALFVHAPTADEE